MLTNQHLKDEIVLELKKRGQIVATCSVWLKNTPLDIEGNAVGTIGRFYANNENNAHIVLDKAINIIKEEGCKTVVGPMNGNTWNPYRFIVESNGAPRFFLEDYNPLEYPKWFQAAGFHVSAEYFSKEQSLINNALKLEKLYESFNDKGFSLRCLSDQNFEHDLETIYEISKICFENNYLYSPIDKQCFKEKYRKLQPMIIPELIRIAYCESDPIGFLFVVPNLFDTFNKTIVAKTIGILPGFRNQGVAKYMLYDTFRKAHAMNFERAIVAYIYADNISRKLLDEDAVIIRRYQLFERNL